MLCEQIFSLPMQDVHPSMGPSSAAAATAAGRAAFADRRLRPHGHHHMQQALKCPRCDSLNTKFCYYNNYNLSQPRHFCKNCRRYWTKGGVLRNVPVGGGCRKSKRSSKSKPKPQPSASPSRNSSVSLSPPIQTPNLTPVAGERNGSVSLSNSEGSATNPPAGGSYAGGNDNNIINNNNNSMFQIPEPKNYGVPLVETANHQQIGDLLFTTDDINGFSTLMGSLGTAADHLGTASFSEFLQSGHMGAVESWGMRSGGGAQEDDNKIEGLVGGMVDQTVRIDDFLQNRETSGGFSVLDWQSENGQGLFDLTASTYWTQTTSSHHQDNTHPPWSDDSGSDHPLFLP